MEGRTPEVSELIGLIRRGDVPWEASLPRRANFRAISVARLRRFAEEHLGPRSGLASDLDAAVEELGGVRRPVYSPFAPITNVVRRLAGRPEVPVVEEMYCFDRRYP